MLDEAELNVLNQIFTATVLPAYAAAFMGLTNGLSDAGGVTEPTGGYARIDVQNNWTVSDGMGTSITDIEFAKATSAWVTTFSFISTSGVIASPVVQGSFFHFIPASLQVVAIGQTIRFRATLNIFQPLDTNHSNFVADSFLNHVLNGITWAKPAGTFVALSTSDPLDDNSGLAEPIGNNYARVAVLQTSVGWTVAVDGKGVTTFVNAAEILFPMPEPGGWGTITHYAIMDAATGGNLLWRGQLATAYVSAAGKQPRFVASDISGSIN